MKPDMLFPTRINQDQMTCCMGESQRNSEEFRGVSELSDKEIDLPSTLLATIQTVVALRENEISIPKSLPWLGNFLLHAQ